LPARDLESLRAKALQITALLDEHYPGLPCYLEYDGEKPWQLLFSTILSAQCTDARVNLVTARLYKKYPDLAAFASANREELENDIRETGFFRMKAAHIIASAGILLEAYGGRVPMDMDELLALPGVGRKTANLIRGQVFMIPSVIVDTHVKRISVKLGLSSAADPEKIEYDLMEVLPEDHWTVYNVQIIAHGRTVCTARAPRCGECFLREVCQAGSLL